MIISVSGKIGSGKDTVGKIIQYLLYMSVEQKGRYYPYDVFIKEIETVNFHGSIDWEIKKFADKLKEIICLLLGCTREQLEDRDFKEKELGKEWWYRKLERRGGYGTTLLPYDTPSEVLENYRNLKTVKLTPRLLLQLLGTECGRDILHPNIWVNALMSKYVDTPKLENYDNKSSFSYPNWIITDTRFPNELQAVKERGGISIKVVREYSKKDLLRGSSPAIRDEKVLAKLAQRYKTMEDLPIVTVHPSETALDDAKFDYEIINDGSIEELIEKVKQILILEKII